MSIVIPSISVRQHLIDFGIPSEAIYLPAANYACPTEAWIFGEFAGQCRLFLVDTVGPYESGDAACDSFADGAAFYARVCHRRTLSKPRETELAFGPFWYFIGGTPEPGNGHAINAFLCLKDGVVTPTFFEPQGCTKKLVNRAEANVCELLQF